MKAYRHGAQGAEQLSSSQLIPDSRSIAGQGVKNEREHSGASQIPSGGTGINRRSIMNMFVSSAAAAVAAPAVALASAPESDDPIFDLIEAHKAAERDIDEHILLEDQLCAIIPEEKRASTTWGSELKLVETDDPRWIEFTKGMVSRWQRAQERACALLNVGDDLSVAGAVALLAYVVEHHETGSAWPEQLMEDADGNYVGEWSQCLHRVVLGALERAAA
ncbi:hypothetical protein [Bradyrhizobium sp. USDA 4520]